MSIFFTDREREDFHQKRADRVFSNLYWGLMNRVDRYTAPASGLPGASTVEYWHCATEFLGDAAFVCSLKKDARLNSWVRSTALALSRLPETEWVGPWFRRAPGADPKGHLETAHLAIAVALALDLAPEVFRFEETQELRNALREKALPLCRRWLEENRTLANWHCILLAGYAVSAAVLQDAEAMAWAAVEYEFCLNAVQEDGSYGESLQYASYCYWGLMLTWEALTRQGFALDISRYGKSVDWFCHALLYRKPLAGWGAYPRPRSINFNDSAALFGPSPDLLTHISRQQKQRHPREAGLARWLFDRLYAQNPGQGPFDRSSFGFCNRYGFLSLVNYSGLAVPVGPADTLPRFARFSCGNAIARSDWGEAPTVVAMSTSGEAMQVTGHLHGDLNSIQLAHRGERLLADAGHSCYRNLARELDVSSATHNTCTFHRAGGESSGQRLPARRHWDDRHAMPPPVRREGRFLLAQRQGDVTVFGNDAAEAYGAPVTEFTRFAVLCGENVMFVIDRINTSEPVSACWHWLLNNRDGELEYKSPAPDRLVVRRGNAGMKLFHLSDQSRPGGFQYGYMHDAYHPLPDQDGEGAPGSGVLFHWRETEPAAGLRMVIHAVAVDEYGPVAQWHLRKQNALQCSLEGLDKWCDWHIDASDPARVIIRETVSGRGGEIVCREGEWSFSSVVPILTPH